MPRSIWSGAITFGLVNVPVKVYPAVRDHTVHFHQVVKASGSRIRYEKVAEKTGHEVKTADVELGYEVGKGQLVVLDPKEVAALRPRTTRTIDITDFVDLAEVDPVFYNRTYWLAPDGDAAARAYTRRCGGPQGPSRPPRTDRRARCRCQLTCPSLRIRSTATGPICGCHYLVPVRACQVRARCATCRHASRTASDEALAPAPWRSRCP
jgi:hypothetical protein